MKRANSRPPQLPPLLFGRAKPTSNNIESSKLLEDAQAIKIRRKTWQSLRKPRLAHIASIQDSHGPWSDFYGSQPLPVITVRTAATVRSSLDTSASPRTLLDLPVTEQLAWVGIQQPAEVHERLQKGLSWSTGGWSDSEDYDEKYDEKESSEESLWYGDYRSGCIARSDQLSSLQTKFPLPPCLLYTSPSPRDGLLSRMPSSA